MFSTRNGKPNAFVQEHRDFDVIFVVDMRHDLGHQFGAVVPALSVPEAGGCCDRGSTAVLLHRALRRRLKLGGHTIRSLLATPFLPLF